MARECMETYKGRRAASYETPGAPAVPNAVWEQQEALRTGAGMDAQALKGYGDERRLRLQRARPVHSARVAGSLQTRSPANDQM